MSLCGTLRVSVGSSPGHPGHAGHLELDSAGSVQCADGSDHLVHVSNWRGLYILLQLDPSTSCDEG